MSNEIDELFIIDGGEVSQSVWKNIVALVKLLWGKQTFTVLISDKKKPRTVQQNKYFWKLCGLIESDTGTDKEVIKGKLMRACGFVNEYWYDGQACSDPVSSTALKVSEFGILIEATQALCESLGVVYPKPEYYGYDF